MLVVLSICGCLFLCFLHFHFLPGVIAGFKIGFIVRPHPGPLLQGEGELAAAFLKNLWLDLREGHSQNQNCESADPLPGERTKVRACVITNFSAVRRGSFVAAKHEIISSPVGAAYSDDVAPTELGSICGFIFYNDASPNGLGFGTA
jgi:hypothetical protein